MARTRRDDALSLAEHVCLTLLAQEPRHGWAIVRVLAPDGELGRIWTLSRALTYRALEQLEARGLVEPHGEEAGAGARRTILAATRTGKRRSAAWLRTPVTHMRDVRTEFLLKYTLTKWAGDDPRVLARAQLAAFADAFTALRDAGVGSSDPVARWRAESSAAVERFLRGLT